MPTNSPPNRTAKALRHALAVAAGGLSALILAIAIAVAALPFPIALFDARPDTSTRVLDRRGELLYEIPSPAGTRSRWVELEAISPHLTAAILAAEDGRFFHHAGIDGLAMGRAALDHLRGHQGAGGASTITQQLVKRVLMPDAPRTLGTKLEEIAWAWRLELALPKDRILTEYLNRAPFGPQLVGIEAAARDYFGLSAQRLTPKQAALLAALPNAPDALNPRRYLPRAEARATRILEQMARRGDLSPQDLAIAIAEPLAIAPLYRPLLAPHLTSRLRGELNGRADRPEEIQTTLDARLQRHIEALIDTPQHPQARGLPLPSGGQHQAAIVVLDTASGAILAWAGSRDWRDRDALGQNDAVLALRQPGSALKPFIYGLLLEDGRGPDHLLDDSPRAFPTREGLYRPENFDRRYRGQVRLDEALASSLNIPAVATAHDLGVPRVLARLRALGLSSLSAPPEHYGPGLALGNGEVRLIELASAYATLGRLGLRREAFWQDSEGPSPPIRVMSAKACRTLLDILSDDRARGIGFGHGSALNLPFRVAAKTGTSSGHRDNLAIGVTPAHTVAVWVGHLDGKPVDPERPHLAAAPILRSVFQRLYPEAGHRGQAPWF